MGTGGDVSCGVTSSSAGGVSLADSSACGVAVAGDVTVAGGVAVADASACCVFIGCLSLV